METQAQLQAVQDQNRILGRLLNVSLILNSNLARDPLLQFIMTAACEISECEAASIMLYNRNTDELRFVASNTPGTDVKELAKIKVPMEGSIGGQIVRDNRTIVINNAADDSRIYRTVDKSIGFQTRSLMGIPMQIQDQVVGVLEVCNKKNGDWTPEDRNYMLILAAQAAVAIQNAQQSQALQKAYDELHKVDKIKNDFIAIASHELRTPLGVILGYASFLKEETQGDLSDHASAVLNSALRLRDLIEDLTNLSQLQTRSSDMIKEDVPVSQIVLSAYNEVKALVDARGQNFTFDMRGKDVVVFVDRIKIGMALTNLLTNAIKFAPQAGTIKIWLEHRPREVWVAVSDNGIGIPQDHLDKIFEEFHQVADHMTRRHNGMGLGLSIAKGMVEAHNGRIWAESPGEGQGSTFFIALPAMHS